ncbi:MAG: histidinol-phosphate transaminase [Phycisphaerae bacterium]|nr:histidinol-phosphate transaminase [Phycisphaerae bacterium]
MSFFKKHIEAMDAYVPGEQPVTLAGVVKLNQNENPYPPSPKALAALREFDEASLRLYPDPMVARFRRAAAELLGVGEDWILPGDGSDDLIIMIARAAAGPGRAAAYPYPTFPFYFTQGQIENARCLRVPCPEDFSLPLEALAKADAAVTFVASPNSPTGATATPDRLEWLAGKLKGLLVIDEAYVDFADQHAAALATRRDNVIVLRSLSKGYSLAGLRLGFGLAPPRLMEGLVKTKAIYNVGPLPAAVGAAALADQEYHSRCVELIRAQRQRLERELAARGFRVYPSGGNFLMVTVPGGDGRAAFEALKARGVLVRYFNEDRLRDTLRITVGSQPENDALLAAIDAWRG